MNCSAQISGYFRYDTREAAKELRLDVVRNDQYREARGRESLYIGSLSEPLYHPFYVDRYELASSAFDIFGETENRLSDVGFFDIFRYFSSFGNIVAAQVTFSQLIYNQFGKFVYNPPMLHKLYARCPEAMPLFQSEQERLDFLDTQECIDLWTAELEARPVYSPLDEAVMRVTQPDRPTIWQDHYPWEYPTRIPVTFTLT